MEEPQTSRPRILELVKISLPNSDDKVKFLRNHKIHGALVYQARYNVRDHRAKVSFLERDLHAQLECV